MPPAEHPRRRRYEAAYRFDALRRFTGLINAIGDGSAKPGVVPRQHRQGHAAWAAFATVVNPPALNPTTKGTTPMTVRSNHQDLPPLPLPDGRCPFGPPDEYTRLRSDEPVTKVRCPTGISAWLVSRYADVREVLSDPRRFSNRPGSAAHVLVHMRPDLPVAEGEFTRMDGREHLRFRRHLAPEISNSKRIAELRPLVRRIVNDQIDALAAATPPVDFYHDFAQPITTAVIAELLGVPEADHPLFQHAADALFTQTTGEDELRQAMEPLYEYLYLLAVSRRAAPGVDTLSRLIARSDQTAEPFTDVELVSMAANLLLAGYDTTASLVSHGILALFAHPDQLKRLHDNPGLANAAGEELVRYLAAGNGLVREVTRDTTIAGVPVAAGDFVVVAPQSANRDPELTADAEEFDVTRPFTPHLGYGHGPHQCVGQQLARLELTTVLQLLAQRVPSLRLAVDPDEIIYKTDSAVGGPVILPVSWDAVLPAGKADDE
jgi:cytochrome P450